MPALSPLRRALLLAPMALTVLPASGTGAVAPRGDVAPLPGFVQQGELAMAGGDRVAVWSTGSDVTSAERAPGAVRWSAPRSLPLSADAVSDLDVAAGGPGVVVAAWSSWGGDGAAWRVSTARRTGRGAWSAPRELATYPLVTFGGRRDVEVAVGPGGDAVVIHETPGGGVAAHVVPADGATPGDATLHPADGTTAAGAVAVTRTATGGAVALWRTPDGIGVADLAGGVWSPGGIVPGSSGGTAPSIAIAADGEAVAAWRAGDGLWIAARPRGGAWSAPRRLGSAGDLSRPRLAVAGIAVAAGWTDLRGIARVAVRRGDGTWRVTAPPLAGAALAIGRDGSVLFAGRTDGMVAAWTRLAPGPSARWTRPVVVDVPDPLRPAEAVDVAATGGTAGALATGLWSPALPGTSDGLRLTFADLDPAADPPFGTTSRLRLDPPGTPAVAEGALLPLRVRFPRYAGPETVRVLGLRGGRWVPVATERADLGIPTVARLPRGVTRLRLAWGPGFAAFTNAVKVRVTVRGPRRVAVGWRPSSIAVSGRDLWVVSRTRADNRPELRLLDASTGRLRRGPFRVGGPGTAAGVIATDGPVILPRGEDHRVLRPRARAVIGPEARLEPGRCEGICTPTTFVTASGPAFPSTSLGREPTRGPDGRVWAFTADPGAPYDLSLHLRLREQTPAGVAGDRGPVFSGDLHDDTAMVPVDRGVWVLAGRTAFRFGPSGPGVPRSGFLALAGGEGCVWGVTDPATGPSRLVPLGARGAPPPGIPTGLDLLPEMFRAPHDIAIARRVAWVVSESEQTLVRIPIPAC